MKILLGTVILTALLTTTPALARHHPYGIERTQPVFDPALAVGSREHRNRRTRGEPHASGHRRAAHRLAHARDGEATHKRGSHQAAVSRARRHMPGTYLDQDGGKHKLFMCPGCVLKDTLAGVVSVSKENADKFVGVINDLVNAGYSGPVDCASAASSHVPGSKHYSGNACDFDQCGWGCTHKIMKTAEAAAIIRKWGLTNGCSFGDCGHVGTDGAGGTRLASRHHHHTHYYATRHHHRARYARAG